MLTRKGFLVYAGLGTYEMLRQTTAFGAIAPKFPLARRKGKGPGFFTPIAPSGADKLIVPKGFKYELPLHWGDALGTTGPEGAEKFGFNNDFLAYFPIDALSGGKSSKEGLLFVNHEYPNPLFVSNYSDPKATKTKEQIKAEKLCVGASVVHVQKERGMWMRVQGSKYNRRITALYPEIKMSGPAAEKLGEGTGSLANCSGGVTPWHTALSCEENFQDYNVKEGEGYRWSTYDDTAIDEVKYGWVVEVDPFGELPPLKHTALGRFAHENCSVTVGAKGHLVVYMGDDSQDQYFYKFVSAGKYDAKAPRAEQRKLLTEGTLWVAEFAKGKWIPLDLERTPDLKKDFKSQAEVMIDTRKAASLVKATPLDRPEDCEIHPTDGTVYISFTNNAKHGNLHGQIVRLVENDGDAEAEGFRYEIFLAGGAQSGLSSPDNLVFDKKGNLWVVCDMSSNKLNSGAWETMANNGIYVVPTSGPSAGDAFQFASGPNEAELTGPAFTPDWSTLFVSVQHPGETSIDRKSPTSRWPNGGGAEPHPAVAAISGFKW